MRTTTVYVTHDRRPRRGREQGPHRADRYEWHAHLEPGIETFDTVLDVTEPVGMETLVYFTLDGTPVCGRVNPNAGAKDGAPMRLAMDLNNMHLLNESTGLVL